MCCATANNSSKSTKDKESARSIVTAILLCLIEKKKNQISISSEMTKAMEMQEKLHFLVKKYNHNLTALAMVYK